MSSPLLNNTSNLLNLLDKVNSLPENGLPELTNPGTASDMLFGKELIDASGNIVTGTIESKSIHSLSVDSEYVTVPAGYYSKKVIKSVGTATQAIPSITVDSTGKITATATQTGGYVYAGTKSSTEQLTTQAAKTITPTKSSQTAVASGMYTTGDVTVAAIPSEYVDNSTVDAVESDVMSGKKFGANGSVKTGTFTIDSELNTQDSLITQIQEALQNKASTPTEDLDEELTTQENLIAELQEVLNTKASGGGNVTKNNTTVTITCGGFSPARLEYVLYRHYNDDGDLEYGDSGYICTSEPYTFQAAIGECFYIFVYSAWNVSAETGSGIELYLPERDHHFIFKVISNENATLHIYDED